MRQVLSLSKLNHSTYFDGKIRFEMEDVVYSKIQTLLKPINQKTKYNDDPARYVLGMKNLLPTYFYLHPDRVLYSATIPNVNILESELKMLRTKIKKLTYDKNTSVKIEGVIYKGAEEIDNRIATIKNLLLQFNNEYKERIAFALKKS